MKIVYVERNEEGVLVGGYGAPPEHIPVEPMNVCEPEFIAYMNTLPWWLRPADWECVPEPEGDG